MDVAVGFVTHSGWAIAVVAGLVEGHLAVFDRRRVTLVGRDLPRQAYHAAVGRPAAAADELVARVDGSIAEHAAEVLAAIRTETNDHTVVAVGVVGQPREIPDVATVLASHALMHASEGEQYRRGVSAAAEELGLRIQRVDPRQLADTVSQVLGWSAARLADEHARIRAALGPPWQKDHKHAATAALLALRSDS